MFPWLFALILIISTVLLLRWLLLVLYRYRWAINSIPHTRGGFSKVQDTTNIYVMICDHYQPFWGDVSQEIAEHRVVTWCREYPRAARKHADCRGRHPVHSFFYSEGDYKPQFVDSLFKLNKEGIGDVEILIAHQHDTPLNFKHKIEEFRDVLFYHHGLLRKDSHGQITYGFIHGYGALNNSRPDQRWCGVDHEIPVLKESGCYADFTYPSAPDITQPPIINSIYFASDISGRARAHEQGYYAKRGVWSDNDLLMIQGPLTLNWRQRRYGLLPIVENGLLSSTSRFSPQRADLWIKNGVSIPGLPNHLFVKLFTHGAVDHTIRYFFPEDGLSQMWSYLESKYNDGKRYRLYYVSAWEMYSTIKDLCLEESVGCNSKRAA